MYGYPEVVPRCIFEACARQGSLDYAAALARVGAVAFPFAGPGVALFELVTAPLRSKRLSDWCEDLRLRLNELSQKVDGLTAERLANDEAFVSAFAHATHAALRSHQTEKLEALRNAILNVAVGRPGSEDQQLMFLQLVDSFTPIHLEVLGLFYERPVDGAARERLRGQRDLSDQAIRDLVSRGLLKDKRPYNAQNKETTESLVFYDWDVTTFGSHFLTFIRRPAPTT